MMQKWCLPHDVAATAGEGGSELGSDECLWDAPAEAEDGEEGPVAATIGSSMQGATGILKVDEEDEEESELLVCFGLRSFSYSFGLVI